MKHIKRSHSLIGLGCAGLLMIGVLAAPEAQADESASREAPQARHWGGGALWGTKCWVLDPQLGKETFLTLHFMPIGGGHSVLSGRAIRNDGSKPDRVLQMSGSSSRHEFDGSDGSKIDRYLINLTYSFSKTGTDPANAFEETGASLRGHYAVRLNPDGLDGVFEGNDVILDWAPPLTGPSVTYTAASPDNGYSGIANNYLGGILCDGTAGYGNCGTILPVNNTGTLTLVGTNYWDCINAQP